MITQGYELWAFLRERNGVSFVLPVVGWCGCDEQPGRSGYHAVVARTGGEARCLLAEEQRGTTFGGRS